MRIAGRYDSHRVCVRDAAHAKVRVGMQAERDVESNRRVSEADTDLDAIRVLRRPVKGT